MKKTSKLHGDAHKLSQCAQHQEGAHHASVAKISQCSPLPSRQEGPIWCVMNRSEEQGQVPEVMSERSQSFKEVKAEGLQV